MNADPIEVMANELWPRHPAPVARQIAEDLLAALRAAGLAVAPVEPTAEMCAAGEDVCCGADECHCDPHRIYRAALAAYEAAK